MVIGFDFVLGLVVGVVDDGGEGIVVDVVFFVY